MLHDDRWSDWAQAFQCPLAILRGAQSFENYPSVTPKRIFLLTLTSKSHLTPEMFIKDNALDKLFLNFA